MFKNINKKLRSVCLTLVLAATVAVVTQPAKAAEDEKNGISYSDMVNLSAESAEYYNYGGGATAYVNLRNEGDYISAVKSSSPNLVAKVGASSYSKTGSKVTHSSNYIALYGKKNGKYTVTFTVSNSAKKVKCKKKFKVVVGAPSTYVSGIKGATYAGKDIYNYYPIATKTSGKFSVKLNKGFSIEKIEVKTKKDPIDYTYDTKTIKNGATVKLATSVKADKTQYGRREMADELFPETEFYVYVKNKKTKQTVTYYYSLCTLNAK